MADNLTKNRKYDYCSETSSILCSFSISPSHHIPSKYLNIVQIQNSLLPGIY